MAMSSLTKFLIPIFFIGLLFFAKLGTYPLNAPDSARYAEIPREMTVTHDYVIPHLNGLPYLEKPPFFYWLQAISIKIFGVNDFAVSLPNAVMGFLCCLVVLFATRKIYGHLAAILSAIILATSSLFFALTRIVTLDMTLTFFLTAALMSFILGAKEEGRAKQKYYMWLMYIFAACAAMTKGLVGAIFPSAIIFFWVLFCREWSSIKKYCIPSGMIIILLLVAPWHILVQLKNPDFFKFYFIGEHFLRYLTPYSDRAQPFGFLLVVFLGGFFPWTVFLLQSIRYNFLYYSKDKSSYKYKAFVFLIIWAAFIFLFYTFSHSKLITYILPIFPPFAILVGNYCAANLKYVNLKNQGVHIGFLSVSLLYIIIGIGLLLAPHFIDFTKQSISISCLSYAWLFALVGGFAIYICYYFNLLYGVVALVIVTAGVFYCTNPIITVINNKSIKPLILILQQRLQPNDEVASYDYYFQDLPFYLQRTVDVVHYKGELEYGANHQKNADQWMLNFTSFFKTWNSNKKMYMIIEKSKYNEFSVSQKARMYIISQYSDKLLLTNVKPITNFH